MELFEIAGLLLFGGAITILFLWLLPSEAEVDEVASSITGHLYNKRKSLLERKPFMKNVLRVVDIFAVFNAKLKLERFKKQLQESLKNAGYPGSYTVDEFIGVMEICGIFFFLLSIYFSLSLWGGMNPLLTLIFFLLGLFIPFMWLKERASSRLFDIKRDLPYKIDLMVLAVEAGLDFLSALKKIIDEDRMKGPLYEELFQMYQEITMGMTKKEALKNLSERVDLEDIKNLSSALIQGEELGTPLGQVLRVQSDSIRIRRTQRAEKLANEAPVKLIFPLLFIFATILIVLFGGIVIKWMKGEILV